MTRTGMKLNITNAHVLFSKLVQTAGHQENVYLRNAFVEEFATEIPREYEFYIADENGDVNITRTLVYVSHISPMVVKDEKGNVLHKFAPMQREVVKDA